jgi:hypothetical protein
MTDKHRHRTITPAPLPLSQPATIGDALTLDQQHANECSEARRAECTQRDQESADRQGVVWARIVAIEQTLGTLAGNVKFAAWVLSVVIAITGIAGPFIARYAIRGVVAEELRTMLPAGTKVNIIEKAPEPKAAFLWSPIRAASAEEWPR